MNRTRTVLALATLTSAAALNAIAQARTDQLMVAPADAERFVVLSTAGSHGSSSLWTAADGTVLSRESILLRGMVWEQDESIHFGSNGQPDRILIRGVTPNGDASETFAVNDNEARWKSPVDQGGKAYDGRGHYVPQGGTISATAVLLEKLYAAPTRRLPLLPGGEARLVKLSEAVVGTGPAQKTISAYALEGLSIEPQPVWLDQQGKLFAIINGLAILPEAYTGELVKLQQAQVAALAERAPALARRFGTLPATPIAFTHAKLFDSEAGRFLENQTVITDKDQIVAVGPAAKVKVPANARAIDSRGKTLLPGIWDCHQHVGDDMAGPMLLSMGITSVRDPGAQEEPTLSRAARMAKGELLFPAVYPSLLIDGKGPLSAQMAVAVSSADEAVVAVRRAKEKGFAGVKFYGSMKREWLEPAIAEAKKLRLHVHGHVPAGMRPADAIAAGYDEITHINFVMMQAMPDDVVNQSNGIMRFEGTGRYARRVDINAEPLTSLIADMARRHITVDPTLVAFEGTYVPENGDLSAAYAPWAGILPPATERGFLTGGFAVPKDLTRADYRASFRKLMDLTALLHNAGVPIVAGTDGYDGVELVRELELYVEAGMRPAEALQAATIQPARLVNEAKFTGSITVGKKADLVLVDGDPAKHIGDLRHTVWVMSQGRLINADELRTAIGITGRPH